MSSTRARAVEHHFGVLAKIHAGFAEAAVGEFGSGWELSSLPARTGHSAQPGRAIVPRCPLWA